MTDQRTKIIEEGNTSNKFCRFSYFSNERWLPIPDWAHYYLELGATLSNHISISDGHRFVVALATPIRNFAAALIATGIIIPRISLTAQTSQSQISKIESLPEGAPVTFRRNNTKYNGIFLGSVRSFEKQFFRINYQKGGERWIPYEESYKIEPSEKEKISLPNIQSGRHLDPPSSLLTNLFETTALNRILTESSLDCVILGQQKTLQQELCDFPIGYPNRSGSVGPGTLSDLVRVKGSQYQASSLSYRSYVLSPSSKYNSQFTSQLNNYVTIFDNAQGFLRWSSYFKSSNWFVVLDKTDRNFDLAVKAINDEYFQNRVEKQTRLILPTSPTGVDLMFFETNI